MTRPDLPALRAAAATVAGEVGLRLVVLFGSSVDAPERARDLDLAVLADVPLDMVDVTNRFIRLLARQDVDVTELRHADPVLLLAVADRGVVLHEAEPGTFTRFGSLAGRRFADTHKFREAERNEIRRFIAERGQ